MSLNVGVLKQLRATLPMEDFITQIFCLVDDSYIVFVKKYGRLRASGPAPTLSDSEVITMLIVGEWLKLHEDQEIYSYFARHWKALFPQRPDRSQFVRQAANLWCVMQWLQKSLAERLTGTASELMIADGFPVKVCERVRARHVLEGRQGDLLVDKGYIGPVFDDDCRQRGINPYVPVRRNMKEKWSDRFKKWASNKRRRIETVISQLVNYFDFGRCKCRKTLQLTARIARKLLAYTVGMFMHKQAAKSPTQLHDFVPV